MKTDKSPVAVKKTTDRKAGVQGVLKTLGLNPVKGKKVLLKPNFNTADPTPGSTHNDTLTALVEELWAMGAASISLGERSYPPTREVMEQKGIPALMDRLEVAIVNFDELPEKDWVEIFPKDSHWPKGFRIAPAGPGSGMFGFHLLSQDPSIRRYFHHVPQTGRRHGPHRPSRIRLYEGAPYLPHQRKMIAEINQPFKPALIILDGIEAFVDGGPATGKTGRGEVFLASSDRVALDAVGVAVLKKLGSNPAIMNTPIFEQEQIRRAAELGLGAQGPDDIELLAEDPDSREYARRVAAILAQG
jgi:uncharacterized protein (DUF362 family)